MNILAILLCIPFAFSWDNITSFILYNEQSYYDLQNAKMAFINDITAIGYEDPIEQDWQLYSEIFFPYFRYSDHYLTVQENPDLLVPRETLYSIIQQHSHNILTFHFMDDWRPPSQDTEHYPWEQTIAEVLKNSTKNIALDELRLKFYSETQIDGEKNFLKNIFWKPNKNLIIRLDFFAVELDRNTDIEKYLQEIKDIILQNNSAKNIKELHIRFFENFGKLPQKSEAHTYEILKHFPADKIFIDEKIVK